MRLLLLRVLYRNRRICGQRNSKGCAGAANAFSLDRAAMLFDNSVTDGQTKTGAFADGFGGEERIEDAAQMLRINATARIGNGDYHRFAFHSAGYFYFATISDRLRGVDQKIRPNLIELAGVTIDQRQLAVLAHQSNATRTVITGQQANWSLPSHVVSTRNSFLAIRSRLAARL